MKVDSRGSRVFHSTKPSFTKRKVPVARRETATSARCFVWTRVPAAFVVEAMSAARRGGISATGAARETEPQRTQRPQRKEKAKLRFIQGSANAPQEGDLFKKYARVSDKTESIFRIFRSLSALLPLEKFSKERNGVAFRRRGCRKNMRSPLSDRRRRIPYPFFSRV